MEGAMRILRLPASTLDSMPLCTWVFFGRLVAGPVRHSGSGGVILPLMLRLALILFAPVAQVGYASPMNLRLRTTNCRTNCRPLPVEKLLEIDL